MIEKNRYRLGEHQITEYEGGALWWIAHHGFGKQRTGRCLIHDDILVLGQSGSEEDGFLKREFLERLKKLPAWDKTAFYCFASELLDVSSGRSLDLILGSRILSGRNIERTPSKDAEDESPGTFRLDKYIIIFTDTKQISWRAREGIDRVVGGQCMIHSGILFIGPKDHEARMQASHEFFKELDETAPWKRTKIWSSGVALRPCKAPDRTGQLYNIGEKTRRNDHKYREKHITTLWKECQGAFKSLWPSDSKLKESSGRQPRLASSFKFRRLSSRFHGLRRVRIFIIVPLLMRQVIAFIRNLFLWSTDHIAAIPSKKIIVNRVDVKKRYKRIMEAFTRSKRYLLLVLILIMQAGGVFQVTLAYDDDFDRRHRHKYRERHRDDARGRCRLKAVSDPTYTEHCGACHFAYQPQLLPSDSWESILNRTDNHFGDSFELDVETRKTILGYLQTNAAEHSTSKRSVKIMRSLQGQIPMRISEIPYIREKHREIPAEAVKRQSIGSLSNCTACHTRAQQGIYDDDFVVIPE